MWEIVSVWLTDLELQSVVPPVLYPEALVALVPAVGAGVDEEPPLLLLLLLLFTVVVPMVPVPAVVPPAPDGVGHHPGPLRPADAPGRVGLEVPLVPQDERPAADVQVLPLALRPPREAARGGRLGRGPQDLGWPRPRYPGSQGQRLGAVRGGAEAGGAGGVGGEGQDDLTGGVVLAV